MTAPKERPILFSGQMVTAILAGQKTQTRRVIKGQALERLAPDMFMREFVADPENGLCPYGQPGDRLWVREAWRIVNWNEDGDWGIRYEADGDHHVFEPTADQLTEDQGERYWIECSDDMEAAGFATNEDTFQFEWQRADEPEPETPTRLRPSIHMPRWASRLTLEVVSVRVERLQAITVADVVAEGIDLDGEHADDFLNAEHAQAGGLSIPCDHPEVYPFVRLWDSINAKRGHAWADNPWVWVVEFKVVTP